MKPRLFVLLILAVISAFIAICASGTNTIIGLGALVWIGIWFGVFTIDMILLQEWPPYTTKRAAVA